MTRVRLDRIFSPSATGDYTTLLWAPRCEEVAKLKISLRALASEAVACAVGKGESCGDGNRVTCGVTRLGVAEEIPNVSGHLDNFRLERETGFGPATLGLGSRCSTN